MENLYQQLFHTYTTKRYCVFAWVLVRSCDILFWFCCVLFFFSLTMCNGKWFRRTFTVLSEVMYSLFASTFTFQQNNIHNCMKGKFFRFLPSRGFRYFILFFRYAHPNEWNVCVCMLCCCTRKYVFFNFHCEKFNIHFFFWFSRSDVLVRFGSFVKKEK